MAKVGNNGESTLGGATGAGFKPGQSGNPLGRPKMPEALKKKIRDAVPSSIDALIDIVQNGKDPDRIKAAEVLIERAYGKPVQAIEGNLEATLQVINVGLPGFVKSDDKG